MASHTCMTYFILIGFSEIHDLQILHAILLLLTYYSNGKYPQHHHNLSWSEYFHSYVLFPETSPTFRFIFKSVTIPKSITNLTAQTWTSSFLCCVTEETWCFKWHFQSWSYSDGLWPLCGHLSSLALWDHNNQEVLCAPSSSLWLNGGISWGMYTFLLTFFSFLLQ